MFFFILGKNPALSIAEIINTSNRGDFTAYRDFVLVYSKTDIIKSLKRFGGMVKGGEILGELGFLDMSPSDIKKRLYDYAIKAIIKGKEDEIGSKKFNFGFSVYGHKKDLDGKKIEINNKFIKPLAMEIKDTLREKGVNSRWVTSRESFLSSVIVKKNNLLPEDNGIEIIFLIGNDKILIGRTLAVQEFEKFSRLDYGRPVRDARSGMLPPKLAKMMINIAGGVENKLILDPFCGSGTILQEAILMGCKRLIGSDIDKKVVNNCKTNLEWLKNNFQTVSFEVELLRSSAENLAEKVKKNSVDVIVTEPYLGPPWREGYDMNLPSIVKDLSRMYINAFNGFKNILKDKGIVVIIFPVFKEKISNRGLCPVYKFMPIIQDVLKIGFEPVNLLTADLLSQKKIFPPGTVFERRNSIIYSRENQYVLREILKFRKK